MPANAWHRNRLIRDAILRAISERMAVDPFVLILGEGAHMKVFFDAKEIGERHPERVLTLPISEDGNTNFSVGLALQGCLPIVDVISSDFLYRTFDSIANTIAKVNYVHDTPKTIIIRAEFMTGGPTSGQRIESLFAHIPGLRVVVPSNPRDAYALMVQALNHKGATVFFEDRMIEDATTEQDERLEANPSVWPPVSPTPLLSELVKQTCDLTVVSYGIAYRHVRAVLREMDEIENFYLLDLNSLFPLDVDQVVDAVKHSGRLLIVEPDVVFGGIGSELVAQVVERLPGVRVKRLGSPRTTIPACRELHERMLPSALQILQAVKELFL